MSFYYALHPRRIALFLAGLALYFACQSLVIEYVIETTLDPNVHTALIRLLDLFSVNAEQTIPTWYAVLLLFSAAVVLLHIALMQRAENRPDAHYWLGLAFIFLYLSMDESASIHEIATIALSQFASGYLTFPWLLVAVPLVLLVGAFYLRFVLRLPPRTRTLFIAAGVIYISGAVVVEAISANEWFLRGGVTFPYLAIATVEETCEMLGIVLFLYALLSYAADHAARLTLHLGHHALDAHNAMPERPLQLPALRRPLIIGFISLLLAANILLLVWAAAQPPLPAADTMEQVALERVLQELPAEGVLMTRLIGRFGESDASLRVVTALLAVYEDVLILTLPTLDSSVVFAAPRLPFDSAALVEGLRANGISQFVLFDTPAVRMLVQTSRPADE